MKKKIETIIKDYCEWKKLDTVETIKLTDTVGKYKNDIETLVYLLNVNMNQTKMEMDIINIIYMYMHNYADADEAIADYLDKCITAVKFVQINYDNTMEMIANG